MVKFYWLTLIFITLYPGPSIATNILFDTAKSYNVGSSPLATFVTDLDGDGDNDIVTANFADNTISVLKNDGNGTFNTKADYLTGLRPRSVFASDLDGDNDFDLIVTNMTSYTISVLKNNGDGTFVSKIDYETAIQPADVIACDLDGDGDSDLAVTNSNVSNSVSVFLNYGDGTFAPKIDYPAGDWPLSIDYSDLDKDGDFDLMVANNNCCTASILKNNGNGTFSPRIAYGTGFGAFAVLATDFDSDEYPDIAVANNGCTCAPPAPGKTVSILKNRGDGTFAPKIDYQTGEWPNSVFSADLDRDGCQDLIVSNSGDGFYGPPGNTVSILKNTGDGTLTNKIDYITGLGAYSVFASDLDGDGDADLAVGNFSSNTVSILKNITAQTLLGDMNGDSSLTSADVILLIDRVFLGPHSCILRVVDVNCDGKLTSADAVLELLAVFLSHPFPC